MVIIPWYETYGRSKMKNRKKPKIMVKILWYGTCGMKTSYLYLYSKLLYKMGQDFLDIQ